MVHIRMLAAAAALAVSSMPPRRSLRSIILQRLPSATAGVATPVPRLNGATPGNHDRHDRVPHRKRPATVMDRIAKGFHRRRDQGHCAFWRPRRSDVMHRPDACSPADPRDVHEIGSGDRGLLPMPALAQGAAGRVVVIGGGFAGASSRGRSRRSMQVSA